MSKSDLQARPIYHRKRDSIEVALAAPAPGADLGYLEDTTRACPEPAHAPAYGRMVIEASLRRRLLADANRLLRDAGDLHWEIRRFGQATRPAHGVDHFAAPLMKLAHAMWIHARGFAPAPDGGIRQIPAADPGVTALSDRQIASVDPRHAPGSTGPTRGEEEEVLASPACVRGKTMTDRDQAPGANQAPVESAVSHTPAGDRPLEVSHAHMNAAHRKGQTVPFARRSCKIEAWVCAFGERF